MDYRKIMEKHLGRKLSKDEVIHHKDGDCRNNSVDNLEITNRKEHGNKPHLTAQDWEIINSKLKVSELDLSQKLSVIFAPRQKNIIFRKFYGEKLTKTECEYYSRVIVKKLRVLASDDVHKFVQSIVYHW